VDPDPHHPHQGPADPDPDPNPYQFQPTVKLSYIFFQKISIQYKILKTPLTLARKTKQCRLEKCRKFIDLTT
jgi:hypothetical protein